MTKPKGRSIPKARRRAKDKTDAELWREWSVGFLQSIYAQILELNKRVYALEDTAAHEEDARRNRIYRQVDAERAAKL